MMFKFSKFKNDDNTESNKLEKIQERLKIIEALKPEKERLYKNTKS